VTDIDEQLGFGINLEAVSTLVFSADGTRLAATGKGGQVLGRFAKVAVP
jgi:hypothetical protein